jgi:hypothetical protein
VFDIRVLRSGLDVCPESRPMGVMMRPTRLRVGKGWRRSRLGFLFLPEGVGYDAHTPILRKWLGGRMLASNLSFEHLCHGGAFRRFCRQAS